MRKPRGDSNLKTLPEDQQEEIMSRLTRKGGTYEKVKVWLDAEWSITTSVGALQEFYSWYQLRSLMRHTEDGVADLEEMLSKAEFKLSSDQVKEIGNLAFIMKATKGGNTKDYVAIAKVLLAEKKLEQNNKILEQNDRRIALLEKKAAQLDVITEAKKGKPVSEMNQAERDHLLSVVDQAMGLPT